MTGETIAGKKYIETARLMLNVSEVPASLRKMLHLANERIAKTEGDGPVYGRELRSTQVIASIICVWESMPKSVRNRK
jgi:hypothetical protein